MEELVYEFEIEVPVGTPGYFSGDTSWRTETMTIVYPVEIEEVKDFMYKLLDGEVEAQNLEQYINDNYEQLWNEHYNEIKDRFEADARNYEVM